MTTINWYPITNYTIQSAENSCAFLQWCNTNSGFLSVLTSLVSISVALFCCFYPYRRKARITLNYENDAISVFVTNASFIQLKLQKYYVKRSFGNKFAYEGQLPIDSNHETKEDKKETYAETHKETGIVINSGETNHVLTLQFGLCELHETDSKKRKIVVEDSTGKKYSICMYGKSYKAWKRYCSGKTKA